MGSDIRKLLAEGENLLGKTKSEIRKNREKCVDCKERDSIDGSTRCAICLPIHTKTVEEAREGRRLKRENKPTLIYKDGKLVYEHRIIMEGILGRNLEEWEVVTWRNGVKNDNRPENLILALRAGVPLDDLICPHCDRKYYEIPQQNLLEDTQGRNSNRVDFTLNSDMVQRKEISSKEVTISLDLSSSPELVSDDQVTSILPFSFPAESA